MAACNLMQESYTFSQSGDGNGVYTTASSTSSNVYTYWRSDAWHFTFAPTENGQGSQGAMSNQHISIPLTGTGFNLSVYFNLQGNITGNNIANLPSANQQQATNLLNQYTAAFPLMAQEMVNQLVLN